MFLYRVFKRIPDRAAQWAATHLPALAAAEEREVLPAVATFSPVQPQNIAQLPAEVAAYFTETFALPATHIFTLRRMSISWHAVIFKNLRIFRPALAHPRLEADYNDSYLFKQWLAPQAPAPPAGAGLALAHDQWTRENYYHWMIDSLPRLLALRRRHPGATLLMPEPVPVYVRKTAALLGFESVYPLAEAQILTVPELLVPEHTAPPGLQNPALLRELRRELVLALYPNGNLPTPTRRVYVSRARQANRRLSNEAEAAALLAQHGFETIYFEGMPFAEQVALMLETDVLMGVHGANLTNILFLQEGARVVELMNEDKLVKLGNKDFENLIYFRISSWLGLPYYAVPGRTTAGQLASNTADIVVDLKTLAQTMAQI